MISKRIIEKRWGKRGCGNLLVLFLLAGCSQEAAVDGPAADVAVPPSVQTAAEITTPLVRLSEDQIASLDIKTERSVLSDARFALSIPGTVFPAPENIAIVSAPITGLVHRIMAHEGEMVRKGQVLLELESLEFAGLVADFLQARAAEVYTRQQVDRLEQLVEKKISPRSALEKARAELTRTGADVRAVNAQLKILGVTDDQLEAWQQGEENRPLLAVRAPISGAINDHLIDLGQAVNGYDKMLSLINLDQVLVRGYVSPEDAVLVRSGDPVFIGLRDFPERVIQAAVATVNPALSETNKSVTVNIIANTHLGWPLPGQNVQLNVMVSPPQRVLTVPLSAVQFEGDMATVFVRRDANTFEKRTIEISRVNEDRVMIRSGLDEGEEVAVTQVFSLKALGRFEQYGE